MERTYLRHQYRVWHAQQDIRYDRHLRNVLLTRDGLGGEIGHVTVDFSADALARGLSYKKMTVNMLHNDSPTWHISDPRSSGAQVGIPLFAPTHNRVDGTANGRPESCRIAPLLFVNTKRPDGGLPLATALVIEATNNREHQK